MKKRKYIYVVGKEREDGSGVFYIQGGVKHLDYAKKMAKEDKLTMYKLIKAKSYANR